MGLLPGYGASYGSDISDTGVVALSVSLADGGLPQAASYGIDGKLSGVGRPAGWFYSIGIGVNNSGHMAMEVVPTDGVYTTGQDAVKMTPAGPQWLGPGAGRAINDAGQVTGFAPDYSRVYWGTQATVWSNGVTKGLGFLGNGVRSSGADINGAGHVVGEADTLYRGQAHAFLHDGQKMHDLGVLSGGSWSWAAGINEHDQVTGAPPRQLLQTIVMRSSGRAAAFKTWVCFRVAAAVRGAKSTMRATWLARRTPPMANRWPCSTKMG